jgi:hypothetical protein
LESSGVRLSKCEFRTLTATSTGTREGTGGWDYNNFCRLLHDAAIALGAGDGDGDNGAADGGDGGGDGGDGGGDGEYDIGERDAAGPTSRTNAECFAISREIAEAIKVGGC